MQKIAAFVSKTTLDWLIPINELKTLDQGICDILNIQRMTQNDEFAGDIMYAWSEGIADTRKHCVAPRVHVMVSERLSHAVLNDREEGRPLPAVFTMPSTPRSMDWVIVLHLFAYQRPQEFAFTESRGLLKVNSESPVFKHWIAENASMEWLGDTVAPNFCYGLFPNHPRPAPFTENVDKSLTVEVARGGMICREFMADWMEAKPNRQAGVSIEEVVAQVQEVEARIQAIGSKERLFKVMPTDNSTLADHVVASTGRDLYEVIRAAKNSDMIVFFSQSGDLRYLCDLNGNLISLAEGGGKYIADLADSMGKRTTGDGVDVVPGTKAQITRIHPVGSELREEAGALKSAVDHYRNQVSGSNTEMAGMWKGSQVTYHFPPYKLSVSEKLGDHLTAVAESVGMALMFYRDNPGMLQFILCTDINGCEISSTSGIGLEIAQAFGGVCGQPARK